MAQLKKIALSGFVSALSCPEVLYPPQRTRQGSVRMDCEIDGTRFEVTFVIANAELSPFELFTALRESFGVNVDVEATFQPKTSTVCA